MNTDRDEWIREDGLGEDKLFKTHKDLKFRWKWSEVIKKNPTRSQVSLARIRDGWGLEAIHWHSNYEARVKYYDNRIVSKEGFKTRLAAQVAAERLLIIWLKDEYSKIKEVLL